ncbi:hypothetical protein H312_01835 [Anncaliia algerae PRA339]|uniref:ISXO2-like transposase domain-containing protein n=1 Tax=Anncaliia algerae PRA339 TaxID=1288291 RepID=A0A059F189_9MICR|nr:hypothetical protein H312_01835 [Anncaliia algerae PRA339]
MLKENTQWILGLIEEIEKRRCILITIPDHKSESLAEIFIKYINPNTLLKTNGYPSYPKARTISNLQHKINHNQSLVAEDRTNINLIEGVWGILRHCTDQSMGIKKKFIILHT